MIRKTRGARKLDMSAMRSAMISGEVWTGIAIVVVEGDSHYEIDAEIGVLVDIELMPSGRPMQARLGGFGEGDGSGCWRIPPPGTEVAVIVTGGDTSGGDAVIVGTLSTGAAPGELDADTLVLKAPKVVIVAATIKASSEGGTPQKLVTEADFEAHKTWAETHIHPSGMGPTGVTSVVVPTPVYTTVTEAE